MTFNAYVIDIALMMWILFALFFLFVSWRYYKAYSRHNLFLQDERYRKAFFGVELDKYHHTTVYLPGNGNCSSQMAYYTSAGYPSVRTIVNPHPIDPYDVERNVLAELLWPIYKIIHCIIRPNFLLQPYYTNPFKINLAQEEDLKHIAKEMESIEGDIVIYGCSRGASCSISVLPYLSEEVLSRVKLVVAESPFDSVENVIDFRYPRPLNYLIRLLLKLTKYKANGPSPLSMVPHLPKHIPIVVIASQADEVVGVKSTMDLTWKLSEHVDRLFIIPLHNSSHGGYTGDNLEDTVHYYEEITKIYKEILV